MDSKGLRERITSGLIVWVLVTIFIQPILSFTWKAIVVVGGFVHQGYVDRIYRSAALGDRDAYGLLILATFFLTILITSTLLNVRDMTEGNIPKSFRITVLAASITAKILAVSSILLIFFAFTITTGTKLIIVSFTQRLTVLAPAISDAEYKTLKARWASMQGKADYDALVVAMDKRAAELGVKLPPVRKP
jgi:hypothetical protein